MQNDSPDILFHLAAQPLVRKSYREPRETFDTNVMGTVNVLEAARHVESLRVCQVITSDKCYENREWVYAYRENDPMGGLDPYSGSKGCAELVVSAYRRSFYESQKSQGQPVSLATVRAGNVIGGGDWAEDRIVPDCIRALSKNEAIAVRNPDAIRPWQLVLEPLSGYMHLAVAQWEHPQKYADGFNFGPLPSETLTVKKMVEHLLKVWGHGQWIHTGDVRPGHPLPHEASILKLDIAKAVSMLSWHPVYTVEEAIERSVKWYYRRHVKGPGAAAETCLEQIHEYEGKLGG